MVQRTRGIKKRRRRPGEVASKMQSIRNQCLECMGYNHAEIQRCTSLECWLYPWRFGKTPEAAEREGYEAGL